MVKPQTVAPLPIEAKIGYHLGSFLLIIPAIWVLGLERITFQLARAFWLSNDEN